MKDEGYLIIGNPFKNSDFSDGVIFYCLVIWIPILAVYQGFANEPFISLFEFLFGSILLLIAFVVAFLDLKSRKIIKVSLNQIYIKDILSKPKVLERNKIETFLEEKKSKKTKHGYDRWTELSLFWRDDILKISSKKYDNYAQLMTILIDGVESKNINEENDKEYKNRIFKELLYLFIALTVILSSPFLNFFYKKYIKSDIIYKDLIEIKGTIAHKPEIITTGKSHTETGFTVKLNELPYFDFNFYIGKFETESMYEDFKNIMKIGRNVGIYISIDEYKKKISKEIPIKFNDKYFGYNDIKTFGAKYQQFDWKNEVSLEEVEINKENDTDIFTPSYYIFFYIWIGSIAILMIFISQKWNEYRILKEYENY